MSSASDGPVVRSERGIPVTDGLAPRRHDYEKRDEAGARVAAIIREVPLGVENVLRRAVAETLLYCEAHSAGIAVCGRTTRASSDYFACVGPWAGSVAPLTSVSLSLEGHVARTRATQVFRRPAESFPPLVDVRPSAIELLATRFSVAGQTCGVMWIVLHDAARQFDLEDARRLRLLEQCAAAAYELALSGPAHAGRPVTLHATPAGRRALSQREGQVLVLVARGYTSKAIGARLGVGPKSVDTYRRRIREKLGLLTRADCVAYAAAQDLL